MPDHGSPVEARLQRAHAALLQLARSKHFLGSSLAQDLKQLSEIAAYALHVARASVWMFDPAHLKIRCVNLFDAEAGTHSHGQELLKKDHAAYFAASASRATAFRCRRLPIQRRRSAPSKPIPAPST
jgi:hypothetical protein